MTFIKQNWFKLSILILLLWLISIFQFREISINITETPTVPVEVTDQKSFLERARERAQR